jgi:hypothetical protein
MLLPLQQQEQQELSRMSLSFHVRSEKGCAHRGQKKLEVTWRIQPHQCLVVSVHECHRPTDCTSTAQLLPPIWAMMCHTLFLWWSKNQQCCWHANDGPSLNHPEQCMIRNHMQIMEQLFHHSPRPKALACPLQPSEPGHYPAADPGI